jgi:uncharacterized protein
VKLTEYQLPAGALQLNLSDETVWLHPARAVIWPRCRTAIVADTHFGKDDLFRRSGIAVPRGTTVEDLQRLSELATLKHDERFLIERILVLGDFLHGAAAAQDSFLLALKTWRQQHVHLSIEVIPGNHDRNFAHPLVNELAVWREPLVLEPPFALAHAPADLPDNAHYGFCGHIHPAIRLGTVDSIKAPIFWQRSRYLVLPAFSQFTGGAIIRPTTTDQLFVVTPERVIALG